MAPSFGKEMINIVMNYYTHFIKDICLISLEIDVCMRLKPQYQNSSEIDSRIFEMLAKLYCLMIAGNC